MRLLGTFIDHRLLRCGTILLALVVVLCPSPLLAADFEIHLADNRPLLAAAPPRPPARPAPIPVNNEDLPVALATGVLGVGTGPDGCLSSLRSLTLLYAGAHPRFEVWNLEGLLTYRDGRLMVGTGTVVLGGGQTAAPVNGLPFALQQLAFLKQADRLRCWTLRNTDVVRGLPIGWLRQFEDGQPIVRGTLEAEVYSNVQILAQYTSAKAFEKKATRRLSFAHLFHEAPSYRGKVVWIQGQLLRIRRYDPDGVASREGVHDLYEARVRINGLNNNTYILIFTNWPSNLPESLLDLDRIKDPIEVGMAGYFLKLFGPSKSPLVVGNRLEIMAPPGGDEDPGKGWAYAMMYVLLSLFGGVALLVLGLIYWFRRGDDALRRRLLIAQGDFVPPEPDLPPGPIPVAPPVRMGSLDRHGGPPPEATPPGRMGDRGGGSRGSGPPGSTGPPTGDAREEDAGV